MRIPMLLSYGMIWLLASPMLLVAPAAAQKAQPQAQSKDALYMKCRNAVIRRYGSPAIQYSTGRPGYVALNYQTAIPAIDQCVANGGRVN
jgi:hypothetical protein